ncbi:ribonuclease HIII [Candidatus Dojkabacteria bacterium]|nr:ribonuclease HIII [Candidatus Dojkabacteria bacterium]
MQITKVFQSKNLSRDKILLREAVSGMRVSEPSGSMAWQLRSEGLVVSAYESGKIVIQGKNTDEVEKILQKLDVRQDTSDDSFTSHIGVDEAGKGDYFGPLVVSAVLVESQELSRELVNMGVRDSKKVSDSTAIDLRSSILETCKFTSTVVISPKEYNKKYKNYRNVNKLLAWGHAQSIENILEDTKLKERPSKVVIDQFAKSESRILDALMTNGKKLEIDQRHGGEEDIAVAAASIVARGRFLLELEKMRSKYGLSFPKGASDVVSFGKEFIKKYGIKELDDVAKISFRTTLKITSTFDI